MHVIGFTGYARSGKTTAAEIVRRFVNAESKTVTSHRTSFADPLRRVCENVFEYLDPQPQKLFQDRKNDELTELPGWTPRKILQQIGTEGFRSIDPEVWVKHLEHQLERAKRKRTSWVTPVYPHVVLIDDVRFPNEAAMVRRWGKLYRIDRPGIVAESAHASEQHIASLEVDGVIDNAGTLDDLTRTLRPLLKEILG